MAQVRINVAGRDYSVGCHPGEEAHVRATGQRLTALGDAAIRASGGQSHERVLLYIALMLADQLADQETTPVEGLPPALLDRLAERLEAVASALEEEPTND